MVRHKDQHYIPSSYLKAWCDPNTPKGQMPYVWVVSKKDCVIKKKAPHKIFYEADLYTINNNNKERDLSIEDFLSKIESEFARIRELKLNRDLSLTSHETFFICIFVAAMYARTLSFRESQREQWNKVLEFGNKFQKSFELMTPEKRERMAIALRSPLDDDNLGSITLDEVESLIENPLQELLPTYVRATAPLLSKMPWVILETTKSHQFITSDNPCVWFDPASYQNPRPFGAGGLISPTIEITFPLTPLQTILFANKLAYPGAIIPIEDEKDIRNINVRTKLNSMSYYVTNDKNYLINK